MKKLLVLSVVLVGILACILRTGAAQAIPGDLNGDGGITPQDALIVFQCYIGTGTCDNSADINADGQITPQDALCLFNKYLGQSSCLDDGDVVEPTGGMTGNTVKVDDWQEKLMTYSDSSGYSSGSASSPIPAYIPAYSAGYSGVSSYPYSGISYAYSPAAALSAPPSVASALPMSSASANIGFSTGGAKDINNFRANIENNYLPLPTDVTYEGLFYDYYFDTGQQSECQKLFCPSYSLAVSKDTFSQEEEYYLSVGLNSGMKQSDFQRKKLNLVIVLDISGSMGSSFQKYHYDQFGVQHMLDEAEYSGKSKIQVAAESIVALLDHLGAEDSFGMVLFNSSAYLGKPLRLVGETDMEAIKNHILELSSNGGTNMSAGMRCGTQLFDEYLDEDQSKKDPSQYENRIIFLTDAMPNRGDTSETGLLGMIKNNADNKIYSTFIGIGVDLNTELVEYITKVKGANYYSVHSATQFKEQMDDGFDYMVTPLVFNLEMKVDASGYEIEKVYGSPEADEATGEMMRINTLFPSRQNEEGTKGGMVVLKVKKISDGSDDSDDAEIRLTVSYEDREGNVDSSTEEIEFSALEPEYFANTGIRKAVLLSRYANLLKNWIIDERKSLNQNRPVEPSVTYYTGIILPIPCPCPVELGQWERQSVELMVSEEYKKLFAEFKAYFKNEMSAIGDETLSQEAAVLDKLSADVSTDVSADVSADDWINYE